MADRTLVTNQGAIDLPVVTSSDLSALQYHVVKLDANEKVVQSTANDKSLGILQNAPDGSTNDATATVRCQGVSKGKLAEAVTFGQFLTPDANGELEVCDAAGEEYIAKALSSGDSGDLIEVLVVHGEVEASDA